MERRKLVRMCDKHIFKMSEVVILQWNLKNPISWIVSYLSALKRFVKITTSNVKKMVFNSKVQLTFVVVFYSYQL